MEGEDRISSLPLDVIVSILSNLEVKDAIRTSVLSRSWRHFWTYLPSLRIGCFIDDDDADFSEIEPVASSWIEGVHHVVSSLRGPLLHFALSHYFSSASGQSALLKRLLDLLLHKGCIETLQLKSRFDRVFIKLPSFHSLKQLELYRCYLVLPVDFQGFHCLSSLTLYTVQISNDDLHLLIHTSNNIATFKGGFFVPLGVQPVSIKLNSPSLKYLEYIIDSSNEKVEVVSAPYLEQAKIGNGALINFENSASSNLGLVTSTAATVSSLYLDFRVLELNDFYDINEVDILMRELRELLLKKHNGLSCLDQTLKRVRIGMENLDSVLTGITLVKFFLLNARVLELKVSYWTDSKVKPSMIEKELQKAKVSSSKAKVAIIPSERTM